MTSDDNLNATTKARHRAQDVFHGAASLEGDDMPVDAASPSYGLMAALLANPSGTMAWRRVARKRCYACWYCTLAAHTDGNIAGEHVRHDGMASPRSIRGVIPAGAVGPSRMLLAAQ